MLPHSAVVRTAPLQDLLNEFNIFIKGALKLEKCNPIELTKSALRLLKNLPAARTGVFEYFSNVIIEASANYIQSVEKEMKTGELPTASETEETVLSEIHGVLVGFISDNPTAWAPIISTWSLELLGEISTKFAGRAHVSINLNETLQLWMNCQATKILVDINTKCLSSLMHSDTETCIGALLDTSTKHSPNFDWVVAHVGSCFPNTVITRVLSCGLKDFCQIKSYEQGSNSPKLRSVVGILGHLAGSHANDIRSAILEMFNWSILQEPHDSDLIKLQKKATVPFILQLAFLSSTFFSSICKDSKHTLTVDVMLKLYTFVDDWCRYFGSAEILEDLIITLILSCDTDGNQLINFLLDCALLEKGDEATKQNIREKSLELLQNIIFRLDENLRQSKEDGIMISFLNQVDELNRNLLNSNQLKCQMAAQIIVFLGHKNPSTLVQSISHLFQNANTQDQLIVLIKILSHELIDKTVWPYADKGGYFSAVIEQVLSRNSQTQDDQDLSPMWNNLLTLLKWEKSGKVTVLNCQIISKAIQINLNCLTTLLDRDKKNVHLIAEILDDLDMPISNKLDNLQIEVVLNLTQATIDYFFICCNEEGIYIKGRGFRRINRLLRRLCNYSKAARVLALRELLERALFRSDNVLFGTKPTAVFDDSNDKLLLKQNKKFNKTIPLTKHSSVFNGGIIGSGKRKLLHNNELSPDIIAANIAELISAIKSCCSCPEDSDPQQQQQQRYTDISLDSVILVSLLLVQFVSPDVMYNGLPWPDEEFVKVTIERDLFIRRLFSNAPVLWDLLNFIACYRPALCYCSVLIRALTATLIHQWKSTGEQSKSMITENYKALMNTTVKVIDIMALGQLLPPPLASIRDVLPHLQCFEIVAILRDCIWCYMRDHIPSPELFTCDPNGIHWRDPTLSRPSEAYTNTLRIIMQRNIGNLGHMYSQMFINVAKHE